MKQNKWGSSFSRLLCVSHKYLQLADNFHCLLLLVGPPRRSVLRVTVPSKAIGNRKLVPSNIVERQYCRAARIKIWADLPPS